jgi:prefoldin subunit 5
MTDDMDAIREATKVIEEATAHITQMAYQIRQLQADRAELRRALYECAYCLTSLEIAPSAMTKSTSDTLVRLNLGGFND